MKFNSIIESVLEKDYDAEYHDIKDRAQQYLEQYKDPGFINSQIQRLRKTIEDDVRRYDPDDVDIVTFGPGVVPLESPRLVINYPRFQNLPDNLIQRLIEFFKRRLELRPDLIIKGYESSLPYMDDTGLMTKDPLYYTDNIVDDPLDITQYTFSRLYAVLNQTDRLRMIGFFQKVYSKHPDDIAYLGMRNK